MSAPPSNPAVPAGGASLTPGTPRQLDGAALFVLSAYGLLLLLPVLISLMIVSVLPIGKTTVLLPLGIMAVTLLFLPFGFGNPHVTRLVRRFAPTAGTRGNDYIVQATFTPRLRQGLGAVIEDADDVGCLIVAEDELRFEGDSVGMRIPFREIAELRRENMGWRGLFLYGSRTVLSVPAFGRFRTVAFAERNSLWLPGSRRTGRELFEAMAGKWGESGVKVG